MIEKKKMETPLGYDNVCWNAGLWRSHDRSAWLHGRSVHEAIPHICGAKAIPTSLHLLSSSRIKLVNQLNQRLCDLLTSLMTLL